MEFQRRKLRLSLAIVAAGLAAALIWHGLMGWGLGRGYPANTFLFHSGSRYSDFVECLHFASMPGVHSNYFPSAYLVFYPFLHLPYFTGAILFLTLCVITLYVTLNAALRPLEPDPARRVLACTFFLWSYPVLYCLDRANLEILLVALIALSLLFYSRRKFAASFLFLLPTICFKLYPAILLLLFFRRCLFHWILLGAAGFVLINGAVMLTLPGSFTGTFSQFFHELDAYNRAYVLGQRGVSNSANAWNLFRLGLWAVYSLLHGHFTWPLPGAVVSLALGIYYKIFLVILALITLHVLLVESVFARKTALLLLYMTVAAPGGGDYKLAYLNIALVILILEPQRRPTDIFIIVALALCLIPKREVILTFFDVSDSGYYDSSLNVIANPVCILAAMALLIGDGLRAARPFHFHRRLTKLIHIAHLDKVRAWLTPARPPR